MLLRTLLCTVEPQYYETLYDQVLSMTNDFLYPSNQHIKRTSIQQTNFASPLVLCYIEVPWKIVLTWYTKLTASDLLVLLHTKTFTDESIIEAVKREVFEETGIETEFVSLVCFRHLVNFRFGCSDVYFICHLRPLTQEIKMDTKEIAAAQWMDVSASSGNDLYCFCNIYF